MLIFITFSYCSNKLVISVVYLEEKEIYNVVINGFRDYIISKNIELSFNKHIFNEKRQELLLQDIRNENPDILFVLGVKPLRYLSSKIKNIPIIYSLIFSKNPSEFGENVMGVSISIPEEIKVAKLKKIMPNVDKIGCFYSENSGDIYEELSKACTKRKIDLISKKIASDKDFPEALKEINPKINCFFAIFDTKLFFAQSIKYLLLQSLRENVPVLGLSSYFTKAGALISMECDYYDLGLQAGEIALKSHKGEQLQNKKALRPRKISYSLNLLVAKRLGIEFSKDIIDEASEVYGE
ncbi:MAG: hypothetical protein JW871_05225 [Endomicrobiales bacterium]|nr:hypothetical protein [Endomicrobiales bacterium]